MSTITARRNRAKAAVDDVIRDALSFALGDFRARGAFQHLLRQVRGRSTLLRPARGRGRIPAKAHADVVAGLLALASHCRDWQRPAEQWEPPEGGPIAQFTSLAQHLLAIYPVPTFMTSVWFKGQTAEAREQQAWFKHLGAGRNIRKARIPLPYTKMMAHHFTLAPDHFTVEMALRWGQVRGLGGAKDLAGAIVATRLGRSFEHEDFWRTVIHFFINNPTIERSLIGPVVDYLHARRFVPEEVLVEDGERVFLGPPQPDLSMKGRTPRSLSRQVAEWHERLKRPPRATTLRWGRSGIGEYRHEFEDEARGARCWTIRELLSSGELYREGEAMGHCVATYAGACARRETSIWSMRFEGRGRRFRVATIEVEPSTRMLLQARGRGNSLPNAKVRSVMERWAGQEGLVMCETP